MLLAIVFVVFFLFFRERQNRMTERQKELERQLMSAQLEVQEHTFAQLSQELHDNVGQLLSTTRMLLGVTARTFDQVPEEFRTAEETLSKAIQDMRLLTKSLNEEWLHQFNLIENLEQECARIEAARQVKVPLRTSVRKPSLEPREQVMLFRVVQEALQNGIRHGKPSLITITLDQEDAHLSIVLVDDGAGFIPDAVTGRGVGIMNMKHRVKLLDGTIHWTASPGAGTRVEIRVPV
jgi:signal transduction histidine kinase